MLGFDDMSPASDVRMVHDRRPPVQFVLIVGLVLLVGVLAILQYQWLGQVNDAERARLHASLTQRADDFGRDLDREITGVYTAFQTAGVTLTAGDVDGFGKRIDQWLTSAPATQAALVRGVYRVTAERSLEQYDRASRSFHAVEWPRDLEPARVLTA